MAALDSRGRTVGELGLRCGAVALVEPERGRELGVLIDEHVVDALVDRGQPRSTSASTTRSEEHTSELQSPMRISYAVLCLKKKIQDIPHLSFYHKRSYRQSPQ